MSIGITEDHEALRSSARRWLGDRVQPAEVKALADSPEEPLPTWWSELADLGWLGLHVPEEHGGAGASLLELAVVLEETGRACLPGPMLPTVLAAAAIAMADDDAVRKELLPRLVDGTARGALALGEELSATVDGDDLVLSGTLRPVVGLGLADHVVLHAHVGAEQRWCVVDVPDCTVTAIDSTDATRRVATLVLDGVRVPPQRLLPGVTGGRLTPVALTLVAAEAAGVAAWCLDTAVAYAKVREQFGRPIGQFQAIKHRCADLLIRVEQSRAAVWDAASALSVPTPDEERMLCAAVAVQLATEAAHTAAKDCVQILGGIGFTWEHDVHLYLKRAMSLRAVVGGPSPWRRAVAEMALAGTRRTLSVALPVEAESHRESVRAFLAGLEGLDKESSTEQIVAAGYVQPHWPAPWGRGAGAVEQLVIDEEFKAARIKRPHLQIAGWVVPTLIEHGTPEQQERWIPASLRTELKWCQLFSEPGAGSDLAALSTRAVRTEGGWLVTGQKVWTSMAKEAHLGILLARTDFDAPKHEGITYFIVDMHAPGVDVRPLRELTGAALFNEVFFSDVFIPDDHVVGEVNGGWRLARTTLANERVMMGDGSSFGGGLEVLLQSFPDQLGLDPVTLDTLGGLLSDAQSLAVLGFRSTVRAISGANPGPESSVRKLLGVEHEQRVQEMGLTMLGPEAATMEGPARPWVFGFLANRCLTIAGGTSEVQRNVIAERLLGLPRDP